MNTWKDLLYKYRCRKIKKQEKVGFILMNREEMIGYLAATGLYSDDSAETQITEMDMIRNITDDKKLVFLCKIIELYGEKLTPRNFEDLIRERNPNYEAMAEIEAQLSRNRQMPPLEAARNTPNFRKRSSPGHRPPPGFRSYS